MEKFTPNQEFQITPEGEEASLEVLREKVDREPSLQFIKELLQDHPELKVYLVGGIIRDSMLGLQSKDYDLVIEGADTDRLEEILREYGQAKGVGRSFGVFNFRSPGIEESIDIAQPRKDYYENYGKASDASVQTQNVTIEDDFSRRDFTINAMGMDLSNGELIDPFGGSEDIRSGIIRAVGNPDQRFLEDPSRILRGIRFACKYGFSIEDNTLNAMIALKDEIDKLIDGKFDKQGHPWQRVPAEKISEEMIKSINADPAKFFELFSKIDLMNKIFPEVTELKGVEQPAQYHSEGDAFTHTELVMKNLPHNASLEVKIAALLHDIGKKTTFKSARETGDRIRFIGHDITSAQMAREVLNRLRFPNEIKDKIIWLIQNHMRVLNNFSKMRLSKQKALIRDKNFSDLLTLASADAKSSILPGGGCDLSFLQDISDLLDDIKQKEKNRKLKLDLSGHEVIDVVKEIYPKFDSVKEQRIIGIMLKDLNERYDERELKSKEDAVEYLRNNFQAYLDQLHK